MNIYQLPPDECPHPTEQQLLDTAGSSASAIIDTIGPLMARGEHVCHLVVQDQVKAMTLWPSALVLTNRRVMVVSRKMMGQSFLDLFWGEVHDAHLVENWKGGVFAVQSVQNAQLRVDCLPVHQARAAYAFAQRAEELAAEWRRVRRLEEERARARGVALSDLPGYSQGPAPSTPADTGDVETLLRRLQDLRDKGLISEQEYQQKRNDVLSRL